jgi:hypothetical protein
MSIRAYIIAQDIVDAISERTYMALFDDSNSGSRPTVDASSAVKSVIARAHSQCASYLTRIYSAFPPEAPLGVVAGGDNIPVLLKDAELRWATIYAYRRHKEYVRTYSAEAGGSLEKEANALMERLANLTQQLGPTDSPPAPVPGTPNSFVANDDRMIVAGNTAFGGSKMGDF